MLARGISVKLATAFLLVGLVPMTIVGVFAYYLAEGSMTRKKIEFFVERVAKDTARSLDLTVKSMVEGTRLLSTLSSLRADVERLDTYSPDDPQYAATIEHIQRDLNQGLKSLEFADLLVVAHVSGEIIVTSSRARDGTLTGRFADPGAPRTLWTAEDSNAMAGRSLLDRPWWDRASLGGPESIDWGPEELVQATYEYPLFEDDLTDKPAKERRKNPEAFSFGFTHGIRPPGTGEEPCRAVLVAFFNWSAIQDLLDHVNSEFAREHQQYKSGYTFLFARDLNRIIGHRYRENYRTRLVQDHRLHSLHEAMQNAPDGVGYHYYFYRGDKVAGFAPVTLTGWTLGFGINESDFHGEVIRMRNLMLVFGLVVAGVIVILIAFSSRRITEPIRSLIRQTNEIARGNLDARVDVHTGDEVGLLGDSFNKMAEDLKASNKRLIQAEKSAAWREMARQVAHEIKNPLTPIKLSAQLIQRAHRDGHPDFDSILEESVGNIVTQTESLRRIASDFSNYAAFPKSERKLHSMQSIIDECVKAYSNRESSGVEILVESFLDDTVRVEVDGDEMRRVFFNVFNNAFEAMPAGGKLIVAAFQLEKGDAGEVVEVRVKDTGRGISQEIAERLFEPYFTTRSSGTGLGLAICKKTIEGYGGTVRIESEAGVGTTVILTLPVAARPA